MYVNGIDIVGYDYVQFHRSSVVKHIVEGTDIHLYGTKSTDFKKLFSVDKSVDIADSEYIDVRPGLVSKVGSIAIQSNSVDEVLLNILLVGDMDTRAIVSDYQVIILINKDDNDNNSIDLDLLNSQIKVLKVAKEYGAKFGNVRNLRISPRTQINEPYYNFNTVYLSSDRLEVNLGFQGYLNHLNMQLKKLLPDFDLVPARKWVDKNQPNTILFTYREIKKNRGKKLFKRLRRNMSHELEVEYEFKITDDTKFFRMFYEMSNYDFITNICELTAFDRSGVPWTYAIHWEIDNTDLDLSDVKGGNDTVCKSIRARAIISYFTEMDKYYYDLVKIINVTINMISLNSNNEYVCTSTTTTTIKQD